MEKLKKDVGIRARSIRERLGYKSREHFAELLDVHSNTVGQLERGTIWLSPEMITRYQEKFGIDPAEFLTDKPVIIKPTVDDALEIITQKLREKPSPALLKVPVDILNKLSTLNQSQLDDIRSLMERLTSQQAKGSINRAKSQS